MRRYRAPSNRLGRHWQWARALAIASVLVLSIGARAHATTTGDQFIVIFTEISPTPGLLATADITLGPPAAPPGFFSLSGFSAISGAGVCFTCGLLTENLSAVSFNSGTFGLTGDVTGSFLGGAGGLHTFDLALTDLPGGTWLFTNNHLDAIPPFTDFDSGTYSTEVAPTPEPATLVLCGSTLAGLTLSGWKRRGRSRGSP